MLIQNAIAKLFGLYFFETFLTHCSQKATRPDNNIAVLRENDQNQTASNRRNVAPIFRPLRVGANVAIEALQNRVSHR